MAERRVIMPGSRAPMVNKEGLIDPTWLRFLTDLYERTGGGAEDLVEAGSETTQAAQDAADAAQAAADDARATADGIEKRFNFNFELDIE